MKRVVVVGSGNVAEALASAVAGSPYTLVQVWARNAARGEAIAEAAGCPWSGTPSELAPADIYLIAVSDRAIAEVASGLDFGGAVVAHTAGSVSFEALPDKIARCGIFYPLQTFTSGRALDFSAVPLFVAASDPQTAATLTGLAQALSKTVRQTDPQQLRQLHLAAVFACNFPNHLWAIAQSLVERTGLPSEVLRPLIGETAAKALENPSAAAVQTGPARRGDFAIQQMHQDMLGLMGPEEVQWQEIYKLISKDIWETSKKI